MPYGDAYFEVGHPNPPPSKAMLEYRVCLSLDESTSTIVMGVDRGGGKKDPIFAKVQIFSTSGQDCCCCFVR